MPYRCRGYAEGVIGQWDLAIADFTKAIRLDPKDARAYDWRGCARCVRGEWEPAIADLIEAIRLDPQDARAYALRSVAHAQKGEVEQAQDDREHAKSLGFTPDEFARLAEVLE
jgi:Flp pilus assembly protein TadD